MRGGTTRGEQYFNVGTDDPPTGKTRSVQREFQHPRLNESEWLRTCYATRTIHEIATQLNVSATSVLRALRANGIEQRSRNARLAPIQHPLLAPSTPSDPAQPASHLTDRRQGEPWGARPLPSLAYATYPLAIFRVYMKHRSTAAGPTPLAPPATS